MNLKYVFICCYFFCVASLWSQETDEVLLTIDNDSIYTAEFLRVYQKNLDLINNEEQRDIENYLDLFINYKLKIRNAIDLGLDTMPNYQRELSSYNKQLIEPYLRDNEIVNSLVEEAYERSLIEINASHILVRFDRNNPKDTLPAYTRIYEAYDKLKAGEPFDEIVVAYSQDNNVEANKGNLGFFTAFSMVYPFENAAYTTSVGEVSKPFKTKFGYHIVKVNEIRDALGQIEAAHIMIKNDREDAEQRINEIYQQLEQGESFEYLAKTQSDDKYSAQKEGNLGKFASGKMVKNFEDVAFGIENPGEYSKPFQTRFGWHIIKLIKKYPIQSFEDYREELEQKIKRSDRSSIVNYSIVHKLKKEYEIVVFEDALDIFSSSENIASADLNKEVLKINEKIITQEVLSSYLNRRTLTDEILEAFVDNQVMTYYKENLQFTNQEYANTYTEYKEGLLLFDLLQTKIWDVSKDTIALENYYNDHKSTYVTPEMMEAIIITGSDKKAVNSARKQLSSGATTEEIKTLINSEDNIKITINDGAFEKGNELIPANYSYEFGISKTYEHEGRYVVIHLKRIIASEAQPYENVRGKVISDYQEFLEEEWVSELKTKYKVELNTDVVEKLLSAYN